MSSRRPSGSSSSGHRSRAASDHNGNDKDTTPAAAAHHSTPSTTSFPATTPESHNGTLDIDESEVFVRYLLEGSGAEQHVDFAALRKDLEVSTPSVSRVLDHASYNTTSTTATTPDTPVGRGVGPRAGGEMYQEKVAVRRRQEFSIKPVDKDILPKNVFPESPTGSNHSRGSKGSNHSNSGGSDPDSRRGQRFDSSKATSLKSEPSRSTNNNNDNNRYTGGGGSGTLSLADSEPRQSRSRQQSREVEQRGEQRRSVYRPSSLGEDEENGEKEERGSQASASRRSQASSLRWRASENALSESSRNDFGTVKSPPDLQDLSARLSSAGFPPLHPSLLKPTSALSTNSNNPSLPLSTTAHQDALSDRQSEAIRSTLDYLLAELGRKDHLVQDLVARVAEAERESVRQVEETRDRERERVRHGGAELRDIRALQESVKALQIQTKTLTSDLHASRSETASLRARCTDLDDQRKQHADAADRLRMQLADAAEKAEKTRARNERTFANVTGQYRRNPNKSGLDRLTLEVVQVYEEKLGEKVREVDELKRKVRGEREASTNGRDIHDNREWRAASRGSSVSRKSSNHNSNKNNGEDNGHEDAVVDIDEELRARGKETDTNKIKIKGNRRPARDSPHDDEDQQSQLARAMGQQVNSLQARLNATLAALQTTQKENDLLQLQLLASKKPEWTNNNNNNNNNIITTTSSTAITTKDRTGLQTRDLIRMDKQAYRLRLYKIDALQVEDARNLLKDVCVRFECDDVHNLPTVLERVEMVMRLVPQMEVFIHHISRAVSAAQMRLVDDQEHDNSHKNEMYQRLPQLSKTVEEWSEKIVDVEMLRGFRTRVHKVLGVSQTRMSEEECLREIARGVAVGRVKQVGNDGGSSSNGGVEDTRLISLFRDLFQLPAHTPPAAISARMNDLYMFHADMQAGLTQLRAVLNLDQVNVSPSTVMARAAEAVRRVGEVGDGSAGRRGGERRGEEDVDEYGLRTSGSGREGAREQHRPVPPLQQRQLQQQQQKREDVDEYGLGRSRSGRGEQRPYPEQQQQQQPQQQQQQRVLQRPPAEPARAWGAPPPPLPQQKQQQREYQTEKQEAKQQQNRQAQQQMQTPYHQQQQQQQQRHDPYDTKNNNKNALDEIDIKSPGRLFDFDPRKASSSSSHSHQTQQHRHPIDFDFDATGNELEIADASDGIGEEDENRTDRDRNHDRNRHRHYAHSDEEDPFNMDETQQQQQQHYTHHHALQSSHISPTTRRMREAAEHGYTGLDMLLGKAMVLDDAEGASTSNVSILTTDDTNNNNHNNNDTNGLRTSSTRGDMHVPVSMPTHSSEMDVADTIFGSAHHRGRDHLLEATTDGVLDGGDLSFGDLDHAFETSSDENEDEAARSRSAGLSATTAAAAAASARLGLPPMSFEF